MATPHGHLIKWDNFSCFYAWFCHLFKISKAEGGDAAAGFASPDEDTQPASWCHYILGEGSQMLVDYSNGVQAVTHTSYHR